MKANLDFAVDLCRKIELIAPKFGCHVALTGGCLYKEGNRNDLDILFYRIRQVENIDQDGLFSELENMGLSKINGFGWVFKSSYKGVDLDLFFPEEQGGVYEGDGSLELNDKNPLSDILKTG